MSESEDIQIELAALADGSLPASRREQLLAHAQESPSHSEDLARQQRALASIGVLASVQAPLALRQAVTAQVSDKRSRRRAHTLRPRLAAIGALGAAATAAIVLALTAAPPSSAPTVLQASQLALRGATLAAPAESLRNHGLLASSVEGVSYPYWGGKLGWRTAGARTDELAGRKVNTVFYSDRDARRIGYTIVAGAPLPVPAGGTVVEQQGMRFHVLNTAAATILTWRQAGHTCILAARGVTSHTMLRLVGWRQT